MKKTNNKRKVTLKSEDIVLASALRSFGLIKYHKNQAEWILIKKELGIRTICP